MNAIEMQYSFNNNCRNHDILNGLNIDTDDVEMYLNQSQEFITNKYFELYLKEDYAKSMIDPLIRTKRYLANEAFTDDTNLTGGIYFTLPDGFKYTIPDGEEANITDGTTTYRIRIKPVDNVHSNLNKKNPFKKPFKEMGWRLNYGLDDTDTSNHVYQIIINSSYTLVHYFLTYIKQPEKINITTNNTSELNTSCHQEIVIEAVNLFMKSVENNISLQKKI